MQVDSALALVYHRMGWCGDARVSAIRRCTVRGTRDSTAGERRDEDTEEDMVETEMGAKQAPVSMFDLELLHEHRLRLRL